MIILHYEIPSVISKGGVFVRSTPNLLVVGFSSGRILTTLGKTVLYKAVRAHLPFVLDQIVCELVYEKRVPGLACLAGYR